MAIRLPQDQQQVQTQPLRAPRQAQGQAPQIGTGFLDVLDRDSREREKQRRSQQEKIAREKEALAKAQVENALSREVIDAQSRASSFEGENALVEVPKIEEELNKKASNIIDSLNPEYQTKFAPLAENAVLRYAKVAVPHQYVQGKKVQDETFKSRIKNLADEAVAASGNMEDFELEYLPKVQESVEEYARLRYGGFTDEPPTPETQELINSEVRLVLSDTVKKSIQAKANIGLVEDSEAMAVKFAGIINANDQDQINSAINKARNIQKSNIAMELSEQARSLHPDNLAEQERYIRANTPEGPLQGDIYRESVTFARTNSEIDAKVKKQEELDGLRSIYVDAEQMVKNGGQLTSQFMTRVENIPDIQDRARVLKYISDRVNGVDIPTDWNRYSELEFMWRNKEEEFINYPLEIEGSRINAKELSTLRGMKRKLIEASKSDDKKIAMSTDRSVDDIVRQYGNSVGIEPMDPEYGRLANIARNAYDQLITERPSGLTPLEIRKRVSDALYNSEVGAEKQVPRGGITGPIRDWFSPRYERNFPESPLQINTSNPNERISAHPSWVNAIQDNRRTRGLEPFSDSQIQDILRRQKDSNPSVDYSRPYAPTQR